jgi:methyl-accepting chemotaxis protein
LLDLHLSRTIERERFKDKVMRKFVQLAEDVENDLKELDNDADELDRRRRQSKEAARQVINDHHRIQDRIDEGIAAMQRVSDAAGLLGQNTRTAAELAAMKAEEDAKIKAEIEKDHPLEPKEGSGDTPPNVTFPKAAE